MRHILRITIPRPAMGGCLFLGKLQCIGFTVTAKFFQRPRDISIPIIIPLPTEFQFVHILGTLASGFPNAICIILYPHLDGIVSILNRTGSIGILGVIRTLTGLHGICSPAPALLHHNGLDCRNIFRDTKFTGILLNGGCMRQHFRTQSLTALGISQKGRTTNDPYNQNQNNKNRTTACHQCCKCGFHCMSGGFCHGFQSSSGCLCSLCTLLGSLNRVHGSLFCFPGRFHGFQCLLFL